MKKETYDKGSQRHTITMALGITVLVFLMLVSISGCVSFSGITNSGSNNVSILNKSDEALKAYDKAIEINPQNTDAWNNKGDTLSKQNKYDEAKKAYDKAIEIDSQNSKLGAEDNNGE